MRLEMAKNKSPGNWYERIMFIRRDCEFASNLHNLQFKENQNYANIIG